MVDFLHFLKNTSYPGRGILVGKDRVYYFIMGRSENSRNRVFVKTDDGIRTEAFDPAKLADPSLIICLLYTSYTAALSTSSTKRSAAAWFSVTMQSLWCVE